jgi:hypothetical protein
VNLNGKKALLKNINIHTMVNLTKMVILQKRELLTNQQALLQEHFYEEKSMVKELISTKIITLSTKVNINLAENRAKAKSVSLIKIQ